MTAAEVVSRVRISDVYRALTGDEPHRTGRDAWRGRACWRGGDGFNVSMNDARGVWHDFTTDDGGGVLDLVMHVRRCTRRDAMNWLADSVGAVLDDRSANREERRVFAERQRAASIAADEIASWRHALIPEVNARKIAAVDAGDDEALARAASLCNVLENGPAEEIVREFIRRQASDPGDVVRLIAAGRERDVEAQRITAEIVLLLAAAEDLRHAG